MLYLGGWQSQSHKGSARSAENHTTMYSKSGLLCQLVPSLEMTFLLRMVFDIPAGEGRIINLDESMCCRYDESSRSWTFEKSYLLFQTI